MIDVSQVSSTKYLRWVWTHYVESCSTHTHTRILLTKLQLLWQLYHNPLFLVDFFSE